jgi:hypothetical protein
VPVQLARYGLAHESELTHRRRAQTDSRQADFAIIFQAMPDKVQLDFHECRSAAINLYEKAKGVVTDLATKSGVKRAEVAAAEEANAARISEPAAPSEAAPPAGDASGFAEAAPSTPVKNTLERIAGEENNKAPTTEAGGLTPRKPEGVPTAAEAKGDAGAVAMDKAPADRVIAIPDPVVTPHNTPEAQSIVRNRTEEVSAEAAPAARPEGVRLRDEAAREGMKAL